MTTVYNTNPISNPFNTGLITTTSHNEYAAQYAKDTLDDQIGYTYPSTYESQVDSHRLDSTSILQECLDDNLDSPIPSFLPFKTSEDSVKPTQNNNSKRKSNIFISRENIMRTWTEKDDKELRRLADQYKNDWKKIAKRIITNQRKKVTPNFLKNRYKEIAGDQIKKGVKFSHEEDLKIAKLYESYGTDWTAISAAFVDRTPVMIKNRYYSHIRRKGLLDSLKFEARGSSVTYSQELSAQDEHSIEPSFHEEENEGDECEDFESDNHFEEPANFINVYNDEPVRIRCLHDDFRLDYNLVDDLQERVTDYHFNFQAN